MGEARRGRGRPRDSEAPFRMYPHKVGKYVYAATQGATADIPELSHSRFHHWGRLDDQLCFEPNDSFLLLDPEVRARFIYPQNWNLAKIQKLPSSRGRGRPAYAEVNRDRSYGGVWLLEQIAKKLGLVRDLEDCFRGNKEKAAAVLSLAMLLILTPSSLSHMSDAQEIYRFPAVSALTPSAVTRLLQSITESDRMNLLSHRRKWAGADTLCAVDSSSRSSYGSGLSSVAYGKSKDHLPLPQTEEVVVYALSSHAPLYYRTLPGNMPDSRTLELILTELRHAGFTDLILITDRGYENRTNIELCIRKRQRLLTGARLNQKRITNRLAELSADGDPVTAMDWLPESRVYGKQFDLSAKIRGSGDSGIQSDRFRLTLCLDTHRRADELAALEEVVHLQRSALQKLSESAAEVSKDDLRSYTFFRVNWNPETKRVGAFELKKTKYNQKKANCGFFAFYTLGLDYGPDETVCRYRLRDEQEKYFFSMKTRLHADRQRSSTDKSMYGRRFVEFVGLILVSYLNYMWGTEEMSDLRRSLGTIEGMLTEMNRIHCLEHTRHTRIITPFVGKQLEICRAFNLEVPAGCAPAYIRQSTS